MSMLKTFSKWKDRKPQQHLVTPSLSDPQPIAGYGLKTLYEPSTESITADIVFVHGLRGDRERTWTTHDANGKPVFWPREFLPSILSHKARIMTFGYDANVISFESVVSKNRISNHARNLLHALSTHRVVDDARCRPLIFIAHSLGGLVCEDALLHSRHSVDAHLTPVYESIRGILFMGTPHTGASLASSAIILAKSFGLIKQTNSQILRVLEKDSEVLARIQTDFQTMLRGKLQQNEPALNITCFYEELPMQGLGMVVEYHSAILLSYPHIGLRANHRNMTKFNSREDPGLVQVSAELQRWVQSLQVSQVHKLIATPKSIIGLPYGVNPDFVGCEYALSRIAYWFATKRMAALAGVGGVGKSEIAIEFCYRYLKANANASVFWVYADTIASMESSYHFIGQKLNPPGWDKPDIDRTQLVAEYLTREDIGPWIMVIDGADDLETFRQPRNSGSLTTLAGVIPRIGTGYILITTRDERVGQALTGNEAITVELLSETEAISLFRSKIPWPPDHEKEIEQRIIDILDRLPLAITQAAAYINQNKISASRYLAELTESEAGLQELLEEDYPDVRRGLGSSNSVIRTWKLSFDKIREKSHHAAYLLSIMSLLDRQGIPRAFLRKLSASESQTTTALGILLGFSLIKAEKNDENYSMHRLVQFVSRVWLGLCGNKMEFQKKALEGVAMHFDAQKESKTSCRSFYPHVEAVQTFASDEPSQITLSKLQFNMAWFKLDEGAWNFAEKICREAYRDQKTLLGKGDIDTLHTASLLVRVLRDLQRFDEAAPIAEEILAQRELLLGPDHPDTAQSVSDLIGIATGQGNYEIAGRLAEQAFLSRSQVLGKNHLKTLSSLTTLADMARLQGRLQEAEERGRYALKRHREELGMDHTQTFTCMNILASTLQDVGKYKEAIEISKQLLIGKEMQLGVDHPFTLTAKNNLALLYTHAGDYETAEALYRSVIESEERMQGKESPTVVPPTHNLAIVLRQQGRIEEAEPLAWWSLQRREFFSGQDHILTTKSYNNMALLLNMMGRNEEAEAFGKRSLDWRVNNLSNTHPETLTAINTVAIILQGKGDLKNAEIAFRSATGGRSQSLRKDHPDTLASEYQLGCLLEQMGRHEEAYKYCSHSWERSLIELGVEHRDTRMRAEKVSSLRDHVSSPHEVDLRLVLQDVCLD